MKNKSTRHKEDNTFKFQPFSERLSTINIDIFHRVNHEYETELDEESSYFYQDIEKWSVLNLTEGFSAFKRELKVGTLITLPQLVLQKDHVVETLLKYLEQNDSLFLQPLLSLTSSLSKDLRKEFYEYYPRFYDVLLKLLDTKDPEQLEWVFSCLAYFFKYLWRCLIKDITKVLNSLLPLLSENKPEYINNFAAESFAFVARKVKDWKSFLVLFLKIVERNDEAISGCGKLLFEVVKGVDGNFHSCANEIFPLYLNSLKNSELPQNILIDVLEITVAHIVEFIRPDKSALFWTALLDSLNNCDNERNLENLLKLLGQSLEYKNGKFLQNPSKVIEKIVNLLQQKQSEHIALILVKISIVILLSRVRISQENSSVLVKATLGLENEKAFLYFVDNTTSLPVFETLILPNFLKSCVQNSLKTEHFNVLTNIVLNKSPLCFSGIHLKKWKKYQIVFENSTIENKILQILERSGESRNYEEFFKLLVCVPHLNLVEKNRITEKIAELMKETMRNIKDNAEKKQLFFLNSLVECLIHLNETEFLTENFEEFFNIILENTNENNVLFFLNMLTLILIKLKDGEHINIGVLQKIHQSMEKFFSSPFHEVRLLITFIYSLFENIPQFDLKHSDDPEVPKEKFQLFSICHKIESVDPQIDTYRDNIRNLEKLNFNKPQVVMCNQTEFQTVPLRYLCGVLYINFQLIWEPTLKIIEGYANVGLKTANFWNVYHEQFTNDDEYVEKIQENDCEIKKFDASFENLDGTFEKWQVICSKPDYNNHRLLLLKGLCMFPEIAEMKTRNVSELFLSFYNKEFVKFNSELALTWNIKQNDSGSQEMNLETEDALEPEKVKNNGNKLKIKTLLEYLTLFSKFKSPKSVYKESEINKIYNDLLQHKNSQVQKLALDCLSTYKHKFLTQHKQNLYNLIDDKNFRNELATFHVDSGNTQVLEEYRDELMSVVLSIVYSKMKTKIGMRTGGKSSGQHKRTLIIKFLSGCHENEKIKFIRMIFKNFEKYLNEDIEKIVENVELDKFVPPKKLQSSLNMLNVIFEHFNDSLSGELLKELLKYVLIIGAFLKGAFKKIEQVHAGYYNSLKILRSSCLKLVHLFFEKFKNYTWSDYETENLFGIFIIPYMSKLNTEGIHSPTILLKIFACWASNSNYYKYLNKNVEIIKKIIELLLNEKSHHTVVLVIFEMIEKLLQNDEFDVQILIPHVSKILLKLQNNLRRKSKNLNKLELSILSKISEFVKEPKASEETLSLLLPVAHKKFSGYNIDEEVGNKLLVTIKNLLGNLQDPSLFLEGISQLFAFVNYNSGKKLLLTISDELLEQEGDKEIIHELNAFDVKWLDQPDHTRRLNAFKTIHNLIREENLHIELGRILVFNSFQCLHNEKDLSLRENSLHLLKTLCPYLLKKYEKSCKVRDELLETIFEQIRKGMKNKNDEFRNECISLLGTLARKCPKHNVVLRDLNLFTNEVDLEVDFFENIVHLQVHRHGRAMLKLCEILKNQSSAPSVQSVTRFILPLISHYLCNEKYSNKNSLIDAAIESICVIARILPWHQYEGLLKFYLNKLRGKQLNFQKQLVRLTVAILDAFHFDLSKANDKITIETTTIPESKNIEENSDQQHEDNDENKDVGDALEVATGIEGEEDEIKNCKPFEKNAVLCKSTATRVIHTIQTIFLPQLHRTLAEMTHKESSHKINRKLISHEDEEENLIKVPISLALVKLLQKLPEEILERNLTGIFMKTCTFLKSRLESVRKVARETLQKIMITLGPSYLGSLLGEMTPLLQRGFHAHVLVFTVHGVLNSLKEYYKPGDIDRVLLSVLELCNTDLFGILSEEKDVTKIKARTSEVKLSKSLDTFQIVSQFITEKCLMDLVLPIKKILETSTSFKMVNKAQECLRCIAMGIIENNFLTTETLIKFAYGTASEKIPQLIPGLSKTDEKKTKKIERPDCYLISTPPVGRSGVRLNTVKTAEKANAHLLVEFGLRLCFMLLKKDKLKDDMFLPFLDPFVVLFKDCLKSKHVKVSTLTLQCFSWIFKYELPSLKIFIKEIVAEIFKILHKYAAAGLSKGDNFDLIVAAFKATSVLLREVKFLTIEKEQLLALLLYVEQDMYDHDRQAVAFNLLKAILVRKLNTPEILEIMNKVAELSITSELDHVRNQARAVFHQFIMDYPLGKKLEKHISFYLSQTSFEMQYGRESALEMIQTLINSFPMATLKQNSGTIWITLGARLVNEEVPIVRKTVAQCLTNLLNRLQKVDREPLFEIVTLWFTDKNITHRRLAAQLCGIFVNVEKNTFETRFQTIIPIIMKQFGIDEKPGQFVKISDNNKKNENDADEEKIRMKDHHYFQVLQLLLKICKNCPGFLKQEDTLSNFAVNCQNLLSYPHDWVRLASCQFLGYVLSSVNIEHLSELLLKDEQDETGYLTNDPNNSMKTLTLDLCDQLKPNLKPDLAEQVVKNLVFIARVVRKIPLTDAENKVNLLWLCKKLRKIVNAEVIENSESIVLRTEIFKWIAGVVTALDIDEIQPVLYHLMAPLVREMITTEEKNAPIRQLGKEVANIIKKKIGLDPYTETLTKLQQTLNVKRAERKRKKNQLAVTDPELHAQKKIKRNEKKKDSKKRKISELKGIKKNYKKRKTLDDSEII